MTNLTTITKFSIGALSNLIAETHDLQEKLIENPNNLREILTVFHSAITRINAEYAKINKKNEINNKDVQQTMKEEQFNINMDDIMICKLTQPAIIY